MSCSRVLRLLTAAALFLLPAVPVQAQTTPPTSSFAELPRVLQTDAPIVLTLVSADRVRGRVGAVETAALTVRERGRVRSFAEADIARIERRTPDSLWNGLLIGAAAGAGLFLAYYADNALCSVNCQFVSGASGLIGIGAGAGTAIDFLMVRTTPVYARRGTAAHRSRSR